MKQKQIRLFHFKIEDDIDIKKYILNLKDITNEKNSIEYRGNHIQMRNIEEKENFVIGRLCKVREIAKPSVGRFNKTEEVTLDEDIIESSHFIYSPSSKIIAIQKNNPVSSKPNALLSKLLIQTHAQELSDGLGIRPLLRSDALEHITKNRGQVKKIKIIMTREQNDQLAKESGSDVNFSDSFLNALEYETRTLDYWITIGTLKESFISKAFNFFKDENKIEDASFSIDHETIKFSEFYKYTEIFVEVDAEGNYVSEDIINKLIQVFKDE